MHAIIPLLFIFILFNSNQLKNDKLYRANIFALVGISYFFLLQYTLYWYRIFPSESMTQYIPGLGIVLATVGIALSPWIRKSHPLKTIMLCGFFLLALIGTFAFDTQIKEKLAEAGGYYSDEPLFQSPATKPPLTDTLAMPELGFQFNPGLDWHQQQLTSEHRYFIETINARKILEVRPNCLGDFNIDIPTYLSNALTLFEAYDPGTRHSFRCIEARDAKECLIEMKYPTTNELVEKWHWIKIPKTKSKSIAMDFLIYRGNETFRAEIPAVISSVESIEKNTARICHTPAAWL